MQRLITLFILLLCPLSNTLTGESRPGPPNYAENFSIEDKGRHTLLTVRLLLGDEERVDRYALVPKGLPLPELPADVQIIRTPVRRVVVMETVYIGYLDAIGQLDRIVGAATVDFISHPDVRRAVEAGRIQAVQIGQSLDIERLMLLQPDLILTSLSGDPAFDVPPKLIRSGLPVVLTAAYMEPHPLARAEWIRFIAAFFEASEPAEAFFAKTAERYAALRERTTQLEQRPTVFSGAPYSGTWHVAGGESYTARAIADAGGAYIWAEDKSHKAIPLDTERVFLKAAEADIWLHPSHYQTLDELFGADPRFTKFTAARTGQVYNNTRQVGDKGGNNIWEHGVVRPDEVLADLIHIFHPALMPDYEPVYYERLE
jgi:iron complex transport system substrate-binding protein